MLKGNKRLASQALAVTFLTLKEGGTPTISQLGVIHPGLLPKHLGIQDGGPKTPG